MATYKGTKITGTSRTAKVFRKSGIKHARKHQSYLNTEKGHVYTCTKAGKPSVAKWKYKHTNIIKKPKLAVKSLAAPTRSGTNMTAQWKIPSDLVDSHRCDRATGINIYWMLGISGSDPKKIIKTGNEKEKRSTVNLNNFIVGKKKYTRNSFYPKTKKTLSYVSVKVVPKNGKGEGKAAAQTRHFAKPRTPSISGFTFNNETGVISVTITTDPGNDYKERYDTRYKMIVKDTRTGKPWAQHDSSSTNTSITLTYNISNYQSLGWNDYVRVTVQAWARGYAGDSSVASKEVYVSYPKKVTIGEPKVTGKTGQDKCTIPIKTNDTKEHPVDSVRLEYLANSTYKKASSIPSGENWTESDIVDDAKCTALSISVSNLIPERGHYTWVRVVSWHMNENVLYRVSDYKRVKGLETPAATAADDEITILSAVPGEDGKSIIVGLGWNEDGEDDSDGTELSWADEEDTWKSTRTPDSYTFEWSDGPVTVEQVTYRDSATITIKDLQEGTKYFIRARRYMEGETTEYSPYSNTSTAITSETPETIVATCDRYVAKGHSLAIYWTFSGNGVQKEWQIVAEDGTVIANGDDSMTTTQISSSRLESLVTDNSLSFTVQASTGGNFVVSDMQTVTIVDNPTLVLTAPSSLTAQPYAFAAESNRICDLIVIVTSQGAVGQFPAGIRRQTAGDTIHSAVYSPEWTEDNDVFTASINLPTGLDFWDLGRYTVSVVAIDRTTGLRSGEKTASFVVEWAQQAADIRPTATYAASTDTVVDEDKTYYTYDSTTESYLPVEDPAGDEDPSAEGWYEATITNYVTLTPIDTTDSETGYHRQAVQIDLIPPPGSQETDLYDIYRLTGDGAVLIGESFPLTCTTTDEYAPFGEDMTLNYRVAIRTIDGDVSFADFEYVQDSSHLRFDWATGFVEYPYNLSIGDSYKKDVEFRSHLDGGIDGYWNQNIERQAKLSTDLIWIEQQDVIDKTRELARYAGPVYVRTPEGTAYEADVQVTDMSGTDNIIMAVAIDATEVDVTAEFLLPTPYKEEEESE